MKKEAIAQIAPQTAAATRPPLKLVIVGHVDHGKSTLVGRLLHDTGMLPPAKFDSIQESCRKRGMPFEWAFLMDALQVERDQNVTLDTTQVWLRRDGRDIVLIDAPGHKEFLQNMVTGAAQADAALILIDAKEGVREQSRRHGHLLHLLGITQVAIVVNKMDTVGYDEKTFKAIEKEYDAYLQKLGIKSISFIPISAREGEGLTAASRHMPWYKGPGVLQILSRFESAAVDEHLPLRLPVQDVYKFDDRRILAGRIESGRLKVGDTLLFSPANTQAKIASIENWGVKPSTEAMAGQSIGITLDQPIFVERGQLASHVEHPPQLTNLFRARLFWLGREPLKVQTRYRLRLNTCEVTAEIRSIESVTDAETLAQAKAEQVERGQVAEVVWRTRGVMALDEFTANPRTGRFVILQDYAIAGGGTISMEGLFDQRPARPQEAKSKNIAGVELGISAEERAVMNGHTGGILWFTGLSGSGKSTLATQLQQRLFAKGYQVYVLDGDNIRKGLSRDLGFSPEERSENIRRVAEVAALFAQAGVIVITAFISPYREDRHHARATAPEDFHTIYIKASLETCERRDTKGLYKKAREGKIKEFTGVSAPYEAPESPDLVIDTEALSLEASLDRLMKYVDHHLVEPVRLKGRP